MRVLDIESDGLLPGQCDPDQEITKVHCINAVDRATGTEYRFTDHEYYQNEDGSISDVRCPRDGDIQDGLTFLRQGELAGHNVIGYDIPALRYIYPECRLPKAVYDSAVSGKCLYPNLKDKDFANKRKGKLPQDFYAGDNSLKAWALRAGKALKDNFNPKDYGHTWKTMPFTKVMDDYCMADCRANVDVIEMQEKAAGYSQAALDLEFAVKEIISVQERAGVRFNVKDAGKFCVELYLELYDLEVQARESFPPFYIKGKEFTPKRSNKTMGYTAGATVTKLKYTEFNPGSRRQIENRLRFKYDWEPTEFTKTGLAEISEETLGTLPFKEARTITKYMTVQKRLSQLAEGKQAWLKAVKPSGRIHGRVDQLGTGTGRMSHFGPNLAQVPKNGKPYGERCRSLFVADEGRVLLGMDADALELRVLAHFLARFDSGAYVKTVLDGDSSKGTDMHSRNMRAIQLLERETAKTWFYAFIYGAQDFKLGTIVVSEFPEAKLLKFYAAYPAGQKRRSAISRLGTRSRGRLVKTIPAFGELVDKIQGSARRGYILGLDKRRIPIRAMHSALNFLCQGAGALIMKRALVIAFQRYHEKGLDVIPLLNIHDEFQLSVLDKESHEAGQIAAEAVREAGEYYNFRCPLAGNYDIGQNWSQTH